MATTLHLGDCLNGCDICKANYHHGRERCEDCGLEECEGKETFNDGVKYALGEIREVYGNAIESSDIWSEYMKQEWCADCGGHINLGICEKCGEEE